MFSGKIRWVIPVLCGLGLAAGLLARPSRGEEPTYKGKSLAEWVVQLKSYYNWERREAVWAIGKMKPPAREAVPALVPLLDDPDDATREVAAEGFGGFNGKKAL
jgi:hypothetical protein